MLVNLLLEETYLIRAEQSTGLGMSQMLLGVITLFLYHNTSICFSPRPLPVQSQVLRYFINVTYGFHVMDWALYTVKRWLVTLRTHMPLLYQYILRASHCRSQGWSWLILVTNILLKHVFHFLLEFLPDASSALSCTVTPSNDRRTNMPSQNIIS